MISTDHGTFLFFLLFNWLKLDTDVGINANSVPVWIFRMLSMFRVLEVQIGAVLIIHSAPKFRQRIPIDVAKRFSCSVIPWVHCRD